MTRAIETIEILNLVDGNVTGAGAIHLLGEAGYSALVKVTYDDTSKFTFLFDTGISRIVLTHNMAQLDKDLSTVQLIVLSHGHYDHVGGLIEALALTGKKTPVLCHPDALLSKTFKSDDGKKHEIGTPRYFSEDSLRRKTEVITTRDSYEIADGIMTTGEVPRTNDFEKLSGILLKISTVQGGKEVPDPVMDDLSVVFRLKDGSIVILAGCCHAGIVNTIDHAIKLTGSSSIVGIVGGLHLNDASKYRLTKTIERLMDFPLSKLAPSHCTGLRGRAALLQAFEDKFMDVGAGSVIKFQSA